MAHLLNACEFPVCRAPGGPGDPTMVADGAGGAFIAWRDSRDNASDPDIYVQHLTAGMIVAPGWPPDGVAVVTEPSTQIRRQMILDGTGGVIIVWEDRRGELATFYDIYAQRVTAEGTIAPGWPEDGLPLCTSPGYQVNAALASDGAGGAIVVWEDERDATTEAPYADIYATRVTPDGTIAPGWAPNGNPVSTAPNAQRIPAILEDGAGGAIIAWGEVASVHMGAVIPPGVRALRLTGAGAVAPGWPADGVALSTVSRPRWFAPRIVSDGAGGAIVAWADNRNIPFDVFESDLFAQRVRADGTLAPGWPSNGTPLCQALKTQWNADMLADGTGGAVMVWEDYRTGAGDVYGQRVTAGGTIAPGWLADGNPLAIGPGHQLSPQAALDGAGGVLLAFENLVSGGSYDLYAQRVQLNGSFPQGWSLTPRPLCLGPAENYEPAVASDGAGGLIVVALHDLDPNYWLYATWLPGGPVATRIALVSAEATPDQVLLTWHGAESAGLGARVERSSGIGDWAQVAIIYADGEGTLRYEDHDVRPGERYGYRLAYRSDSEEVTTSEEWVTVPAPRFALAGALPNPVVYDLVVGFSLPDAEPARIEVFDLAGRQVLAREVGSLGAGTHRVILGEGRRLPAGVYHLALSQGARRAVARAVVAR